MIEVHLLGEFNQEWFTDKLVSYTLTGKKTENHI